MREGAEMTFPHFVAGLSSAPVSSYMPRATSACRVVSLGFAAADPAAGPDGFQALAGAFRDEVGEHLVHGGEHVEGEPAGRGRGVDALLEHDQVDPAFGQERGGLGGGAHRAGHPGRAGCALLS
jgi:hypothetical protein